MFHDDQALHIHLDRVERGQTRLTWLLLVSLALNVALIVKLFL